VRGRLDRRVGGARVRNHELAELRRQPGVERLDLFVGRGVADFGRELSRADKVGEQDRDQTRRCQGFSPLLAREGYSGLVIPGPESAD